MGIPERRVTSLLLTFYPITRSEYLSYLLPIRACLVRRQSLRPRRIHHHRRAHPHALPHRARARGGARPRTRARARAAHTFDRWALPGQGRPGQVQPLRSWSRDYPSQGRSESSDLDEGVELVRLGLLDSAAAWRRLLVSMYVFAGSPRADKYACFFLSSRFSFISLFRRDSLRRPVVTSMRGV